MLGIFGDMEQWEASCGRQLLAAKDKQVLSKGSMCGRLEVVVDDRTSLLESLLEIQDLSPYWDLLNQNLYLNKILRWFTQHWSSWSTSPGQTLEPRCLGLNPGFTIYLLLFFWLSHCNMGTGSRTRNWTHAPCVGRWIPNYWTTGKVQDLILMSGRYFKGGTW